MAADYATDFYGGATDTAAKIRSGRLSEVDLEHVAEEIDSLGKSEQPQLSNRLVILIAHMLKWEFQPGQQKPGWMSTIKQQRFRIAFDREKFESEANDRGDDSRPVPSCGPVRSERDEPRRRGFPAHLPLHSRRSAKRLSCFNSIN